MLVSYEVVMDASTPKKRSRLDSSLLLSPVHPVDLNDSIFIPSMLDSMANSTVSSVAEAVFFADRDVLGSAFEESEKCIFHQNVIPCPSHCQKPALQ